MSVSVITRKGSVVVVQSETLDQVKITTASPVTEVNINDSLPMPFPVPGKDGGINSYTAGETMGGQRLVMLVGGMVVLYDPTLEINSYRAIGFTKTSVLNGADVDVITEGIVNNPGWGLIQDSIYYAAPNGLITVVPPSSGVSVIVGIAIDGDNLQVLINDSIITI